MKRFIAIFIFSITFFGAVAQNQVRLKAGFLATYTSIAEYWQPGHGINIDSVSLDKQVFGPLAALEIDVDLGKNFLLVTGFGYDRKGLKEITHTDIFGDTYSKEARQNYLGLHLQLKYHYHFKESKI